MSDTSCSDQQNDTSFVGLFLRIFWMVAGNMFLCLSVLSILKTGPYLSLIDIFYWVTVLLLIAARYIDIARFKGKTAEDKPATMGDWRRYVLTLLLIAFFSWLASHGVAYLLVK
jgi:hypothetical protein